jgi:hypothetical protein
MAGNERISKHTIVVAVAHAMTFHTGLAGELLAVDNRHTLAI